MKVRILRGLYKNRELLLGNLRKLDIRPTLVRTRKIIFDTLDYKIPSNYSFLDCFAGVGTVGIEALSQNASKVIFVEINKKACKIIENNLKTMTLSSVYKILNLNFFRIPNGSPMDVIFIDPPYKCDIIDDVIKKLFRNNWIKIDTIIIVELGSKDFKSKYMEYFDLFKTNRVSNSYLYFLQTKKLLEII